LEVLRTGPRDVPSGPPPLVENAPQVPQTCEWVLLAQSARGHVWPLNTCISLPLSCRLIASRSEKPERTHHTKQTSKPGARGQRGKRTSVHKDTDTHAHYTRARTHARTPIHMQHCRRDAGPMFLSPNSQARHRLSFCQFPPGGARSLAVCSAGNFFFFCEVVWLQRAGRK
jgi:hypothetical protein